MKQICSIFGVVVIVSGILIAFGPKTLFKACDPVKMAASSSSCGGGCGSDSAPSSCCDTENSHDYSEDTSPVIIGACGGPCGINCGCGNSGDCAGEGCATLGGMCGEHLEQDKAQETAAAGSGCGSSSGGCGCGSRAVTNYPVCFWTVQGVLGLGFLIIALGLCLIIFTDPKTQLGLAIGIFLSGIVTLCIPNTLIGGCRMSTMPCRTTAFPAITVFSVIVIALSAAYIVYLELKKKPSAG